MAKNCTFTDRRQYINGVSNAKFGTKITGTVSMIEFKANCPRGNRLCSSNSRAFVPAVTVCAQRLFTSTPSDAV